MNSTNWLEVAAYRLVTDWTQGDSDDRSGAGWRYGHAQPDTTTWNVDGARGRGAGSDARAAADASVRLSGSDNGENYGWQAWQGQAITDTVAFWYDDPSLNYGWVLDYSASSDDYNSVVFDSREVSWDTRPKLEIEYEVIPEPLTVTLLGTVSVLALLLLRRR